MVLRVSPGPEALSLAGPGLCACPHAHEPWGVHVCMLCGPCARWAHWEGRQEKEQGGRGRESGSL